MNAVGSYTVSYTVSDGVKSTTVKRTVTVVDTTAPQAGSIAALADPVPVNTMVQASAPFVEACGLSTAVWRWGDGSQSAGDIAAAAVMGSHTYTSPGFYTVGLELTDGEGLAGQAEYRYVVVYDAGAGFVTGGGWIDSPPEAYRPDPSVSGKATFGFVAKYQKGATVPAGQTQFNFHTAGMDFRSASYQWLVIAGAKAQYKGCGTINGGGEYGFMLTAIDGQANGGGSVDRFRLKLWDVGTGTTVYDNQLGAADDTDPATAIAGGSIVIHKN